MASSARIEELEKKFNENPRRYFAPLANEYRKAGDLTQAISICRTYVPQQPGHMSGHIVFGQALFEAGELDESRAVFESALQLDPENLIALRHLGDIARTRGEITAARGWYRRVLDADPRNEEIAAQLSGLDGATDAPPPTPVTGVDPTALDSLGSGGSGWGEINPERVNPERTLELPASLAESAQRITADTASWLETEPEISPPPAAAAPPTADARPADLDVGAEAEPPMAGFYGDAYTANMGEASTGGVADAPPADQGLGLEVMEFVPPSRQARDAGPAIAGPADSGDTPAAFVTETMAELYLQQGFRGEALEVYRQLLAQSPEDETLRERVAQLESGSRSSFSAAGGVSDSVIEAATQRRNAPTVRSIRAFFGDLASRRVITRYTTPQYTSPQYDTEDTAAESEHAAPESETADPVIGESAGEPLMAAAETVVDSASVVESEAAMEAAAPAPVPPPAATPAAASAPMAAAVAEAAMPDAPVTGAPVAEPRVAEAPVAQAPVAEGPRVPRPSEPPTSGFGIRPGMYDRTFAEDPFGSPDLGGGSFGDSSMAEPDFGGESLVSRRKEEVDEFGLPASGDAEAFAFEAPESHAAPSAPAAPVAPAAPSAPSAGTGSTGTVNGLFPDAHVAPRDEAAAETLSTAFGGTSDPSVAPGVRRASTELSLDSVFRETPPPPSASAANAPRRDQSAFSFDQFFGYDPFANGDATTAKDAPAEASSEHPGPAAGGATEPAAETEQFSSWLSGLKKK